MFNKLLIVLVVLILAVSVMFFLRGKASKNGKAPGLVENKLAPCSSKPNCVCSEHPNDKGHFIEPIDVSHANTGQHFYKLRKAIEATGGKVVKESEHYVAATYTSGLFKFVDDVEIRLDKEAQKLHIRSASREGYSDMGVNRKRVAKILEAYSK